MTAAIDASALDRFRAAIRCRLGLQVDQGTGDDLANVLRRRVQATGQSPDRYLARLEQEPAPGELGALARDLTVSETYFFRNIAQYAALTDIVLPERLSARTADRHLRILSLGCASGEEAYSLAIRTRDTAAAAGWDLSIVGVDVNPAMIEKARGGRFSAWALRDTPDADRQQWFRAHGREFVLDERLRDAVRFEERNLVDDDPELWQQGRWDVVFCRNVLMYFAPGQAQRLVGRIARALRAGGYLFLGHAETLRGLSDAFHLRHTHGTFYYQRKDRDGRESPPRGPEAGLRTAAGVSLAAAAAEAGPWVEAIRRASERVAALTQPRGQTGADASPDAPGATDVPGTIGARSDRRDARDPRDLGAVLELLRTERFAEAIASLDALPPHADDPDLLLLRAVLLLHAGELATAEATCSHLLEITDVSAGGHYLLALCREAAGDAETASHHDHVAAYLDPDFAMPRLHLGLLARRAGDHAAARRELGHALVLLQREHASRLLLFGGGFTREALVALCAAELVRCGGRP